MPPEQPTGRLLPFSEIQVNSTSSHKQWLRASWCWGPGLGTGSVEAASDEAWVRSVFRLRWQHSQARRGDARRWVTEGAAEISFTQVRLQVVTQDVSKLEDVHQPKRSHLRKCLMRKQPIYRGWLRLCFRLLYADMETRSNSWLTAFKGGWIFPALRCGYRLEFTVQHSFIYRCSFLFFIQAALFTLQACLVWFHCFAFTFHVKWHSHVLAFSSLSCFYF